MPLKNVKEDSDQTAGQVICLYKLIQAAFYLGPPGLTKNSLKEKDEQSESIL